MEAKEIMSLCPACDACPTVEVSDEAVRIGEPGNRVTLGRAEWNTLVEAILQGKLSRL